MPVRVCAGPRRPVGQVCPLIAATVEPCAPVSGSPASSVCAVHPCLRSPACARCAACWAAGTKSHWQRPSMYFGAVFFGKSGILISLTDSACTYEPRGRGVGEAVWMLRVCVRACVLGLGPG